MRADITNYPERISRQLLVAEMILIIAPIIFLAFPITYMFVIFVLVSSDAILSGIATFRFGFAAIVISGVISLTYLMTVAFLSLCYIWSGPVSLLNVSLAKRLFIYAGLTITPAWIVAYILGNGGSDDLSMFFLPLAFLSIPAVHLIIARRRAIIWVG